MNVHELRDINDKVIVFQYASTEHAWTEKQSSIIKEAIAGHSDIVNELNNKAG